MTPTLLVATTFAGAFLIGFIPALVDSLKTSWQTRLNQSAASFEWAVRLFYFTWLPAMPLAGWLLDSSRDIFKDLLFFGLLGLIASLFALAMVRSQLLLLGSMVLLGCSYSVVTTSSIRLLTLVVFPESYPRCFAALNLGFIAVGIGALLGPGLIYLLERWWGYRQGFLYLSLACIGPAALAALSEKEHFPDLPAQSWQEILTDPRLAMVAGILLLYFAMENCLEFWPQKYLRELGYQTRGVQWSLYLFWFAFIATRAAAAWWFFEHPHHVGIGLTLILVLISAVLMGNLAGGYEVGTGSLGLWLIGACYGPLLPGFLGVAIVVTPSLPATALGILLCLSGLDTLIVRPLMGSFVVNSRARTVMRVPTVLALILAAPLLVLALVRR